MHTTPSSWLRRALPALLVSLSLLVAAPAAQAAEHYGVTLPDTAKVGDNALVLNGAGLRSVLFIKVYVIGLWTEKKASTTDAVLSGPWTAQMHMLRGLEAEKVTDAMQEGFERNSGSTIGALQERLDKLKGMFPKVAKGDVVELTWNPARGTVIKVNGAEKGVIEGKDFADALLKVWLGPDPVQDDMKEGMLGK